MAEHRTIFDGLKSEFSQGITLVEASAGTGKTFAIGMLVLRGVVELGINLEQILVVTYTVAATQELRERIRLRLLQGRELLSGIEIGCDDLLREWSDCVADKAQALKRLDLALLDIDSMAIYTIHGFCNKVLRDHALESNHLFDIELISDTSVYKTRLVQDFWRKHLYPIEDRFGSLILSRYPDPQSLYASIRGSENPMTTLEPKEADFEVACTLIDQKVEHLQRWWQANSKEFKRCLDEADEQGYLKAKLSRGYSEWFATLDRCLLEDQSSCSPDPLLISELLEEALIDGMNRRKLSTEEKRQALISSWPTPDLLIQEYLEAVTSLRVAIRVKLACYVREKLLVQLNEQRKIGFDDLIVGLVKAIEKDGKQLCSLVGAKYQLALIDEFQDTDSAQWFIFSRLFGGGSHYLYLIGDPKQAIYRFRGADINSYLQARTSAHRHLTLDKNFRSSPGLVNGVNGLFEAVSIGGSLYQKVSASELTDATKLIEVDQQRPGLIYCQLDQQTEDDTKWLYSSGEDEIRTWVVNETTQLIGTGASLVLQTFSEHGKKTQRNLKPSDIGVLVRTNEQAERYRKDFSRRGVPAVISSKQPVFQTRESKDLLLVMLGVAAPGDSATLRTVMGLDWFGLSGDEHFQICADAGHFTLWQKRFHDYFELWQRSGFLVMICRLLEDEKVFVNLCNRQLAERRIANIQHLIELVQEHESNELSSCSQSLNWLQEMQNDSTGIQEAELRLESDGDAVNVVTMHSAKGLEYKIVFCPFLFIPPRFDTTATLVSCHVEGVGKICDLGSERFAQHKEIARSEEYDEDLRIAYVAITRAQLRCYLFWADIEPGRSRPSSVESALGRILFQGELPSFSEQQKFLQNAGSGPFSEYRLIHAGHLVADNHYSPVSDTEEMQVLPHGERPLTTSRTRTSFSGLALLSKHHIEETSKAFDEGTSRLQSDEPSLLPGGVRFGNMIHDALESFEFSDLAQNLPDARVTDALAVLSNRYRFEIETELIVDLLDNVVSTPLIAPDRSGNGFTLADLEPRCQIKEMEFTLHLDHTSTQRINSILASESTCTPLAGRDIEGYLNGFIDLICEYDGRYYVIDYKTNNLGGGEQAYQAESLRAAMRGHNYGLQYWLYTLVVHRYLKMWLPGYSYENCFGGVMYLFVRGMSKTRLGSGVFFDLPDEQILAKLDDCFGTGSHG